jgi:O-antigen/teichoic acid export membrane protein
MLKRVTYWNLAASIPVFALLLVIPGPLLHLFGSAYSAGATALVILAAGQLFNAATGPLGQVINMSGHPYITLANNAVVAALNIVGCLILIPRYGIVGAACSTTAAVTLVNLAKLVEVRVMFGIDPFRWDALRNLAAAALAASGLAAAAAVAVPWPGVLAEVAGTGLVLALAYCGFFWLLAAGDDERELVPLRRRSLRPRLSRATAPP